MRQEKERGKDIGLDFGWLSDGVFCYRCYARPLEEGCDEPGRRACLGNVENLSSGALVASSVLSARTVSLFAWPSRKRERGIGMA